MQKIVRYKHQKNLFWGVVKEERVHRLDTSCLSTRAFLQLGREEINRLVAESESEDRGDICFLSPITRDAKVLCQGANYRQHMIESGMNPDDKQFNMFFTKSSASITAPMGEITKPKHVNLLDYEIELTLVMGTAIEQGIQVSKENLHRYVAGICIGNDISARDIQIPQMQFHKGKSYRTFCPLGPYLLLLEPEDFYLLDNLQLQLSVNGEVRQSDSTDNLVFKPAETLTEFSQIADLYPGDVIMTGTPAGCALSLPAPLVVKLTGLLPDHKRWQLFNKIQSKREQYLQVGDVVEASITSIDGTVSLGTQKHVIVEES